MHEFFPFESIQYRINGTKRNRPACLSLEDFAHRDAVGFVPQAVDREKHQLLQSAKLLAFHTLFCMTNDKRTQGLENMCCALDARVSTNDQTCENQLRELRQYVQARGWSAVEYIDQGVSGAKDRRPALDQLAADVRRHKIQSVVCWRLDRLGRNLRHLVLLLDEWQTRGVAFVTLGEGIDTSTPAGRLVAGVLASIAEFERARIPEHRHRSDAHAAVMAQARHSVRIRCVDRWV
jgi:predicted site-specific integrase-resolvase